MSTSPKPAPQQGSTSVTKPQQGQSAAPAPHQQGSAPIIRDWAAF